MAGKESCQGLNHGSQRTACFFESPFFPFFWKLSKTCLTSLPFFSNRFLLCSGLGGHNLHSAGPRIQMSQILAPRPCKPHPMRASWAERLFLQSSFGGQNRTKFITTPRTLESFLHKLTTPRRPGSLADRCQSPESVPTQAQQQLQKPCWLLAKWIKSPIFAQKAGEGRGELTSELPCY